MEATNDTTIYGMILGVISVIGIPQIIKYLTDRDTKKIKEQSAKIERQALKITAQYELINNQNRSIDRKDFALQNAASLIEMAVIINENEDVDKILERVNLNISTNITPAPN